MPPLATKAIHFGSFLVTPQVFHTTPLSFALVNLKPILPGHVLICPLRRVSRFKDLTTSEVTDLFATVQLISRTIERVYKATSSNIAIQDGADAGQSVPHVHVHVIPRGKGDLDDRGGTDAIYGMMDGEEGNVGGHLAERDGEKREGERKRMKVDADEDRKPRSDEVMQKEAEWLSDEVKKDLELAET